MSSHIRLFHNPAAAVRLIETMKSYFRHDFEVGQAAVLTVSEINFIDSICVFELAFFMKTSPLLRNIHCERGCRPAVTVAFACYCISSPIFLCSFPSRCLGHRPLRHTLLRCSLCLPSPRVTHSPVRVCSRRRSALLLRMRLLCSRITHLRALAHTLSLSHSPVRVCSRRSIHATLVRFVRSFRETTSSLSQWFREQVSEQPAQLSRRHGVPATPAGCSQPLR